MAEQRLIIEMAQGVDLHGRDDTKAARRAVEQALQGASLPIFGTLGVDRDTMRVVVHVAVPRPKEVDVEAIAALLPYGTVEVMPEQGGMDVSVAGDVAVMAVAAIEVFLPARD
ncbi:MAG: Lin0512 family protein [Pseudomonadota bacterium]